MSERYSAYDDFAWLYNRHWAGFSQMILPVLDILVLEQVRPGERILDVACGTGHLAAQLCQRGYPVTGLDGSAEMLAYARENAPDAEFVLADARNFDLPPVYACALSTFDSLNHILTLSELEAAFTRIAAALHPRGLFCFDMNMEAGFVDGWNGSIGDSFDDYAYVWKNSYDIEQGIARFDATLFRLESGAWVRSDVTLWEKMYSLDEIRAALERAGFARLQAVQFNDDLTLIPITPGAKRGFFVCQKR